MTLNSKKLLGDESTVLVEWCKGMKTLNIMKEEWIVYITKFLILLILYPFKIGKDVKRDSID